jgi:hypothetical protein
MREDEKERFHVLYYYKIKLIVVGHVMPMTVKKSSQSLSNGTTLEVYYRCSRTVILSKCCRSECAKTGAVVYGLLLDATYRKEE